MFAPWLQGAWFWPGRGLPPGLAQIAARTSPRRDQKVPGQCRVLPAICDFMIRGLRMAARKQEDVMQLTSLLRSAARMAVLSVLSLLLFQTAQAQTETVLYNFCSAGGCSDGETPVGPLAAGDGAFYATSGSGGTGGSGTVFGLSAEPSGGCETGTNAGNGWCEFVLYNFCSVANCADGNDPNGNVSYLNGHFNRPGNIYGTTYSGGSHNAGTVFEISSKPILSSCPAGSNTSGGWCETVLYNFCSYPIGSDCQDGNNPFGNLVEDASGNL